MAVQAQYPLNTFSRSGSNHWEDHEQQLNYQTLNDMTGNPLMSVIGGSESDLTSCNAYGFRKRNRENEIMLANMKAHQFYNNHQHHQNQSTNTASGSCPASTSGRHGDQDLKSYMDEQNLELAAFIRLQNQKLRAMVGLIVEKQILRKLEEKEKEVERVKRVKRELEEKVKHMSAENQMWFNMAKQSEATVFNLRQSLVQLLLCNDNNNNRDQDQAIEGFGETNGSGGGLENEDDAQSPTRQVLKSCKGCGGGDVSLLVLPCRHLCLCIDCEPRLSRCPVCNSVKSAALNVFYS